MINIVTAELIVLGIFIFVSVVLSSFAFHEAFCVDRIIRWKQRKLKGEGNASKS